MIIIISFFIFHVHPYHIHPPLLFHLYAHIHFHPQQYHICGDTCADNIYIYINILLIIDPLCIIRCSTQCNWPNVHITLEKHVLSYPR